MSPLERLWKYTALGGSSIVFEEANPIFGGIAVHQGRMGMFGVLAAVAVGTWIASIVLYLVGRWKIEWVRARWPEQKRLLDAALRVVERHPWRASFAVRFAYGLRLPLPIACGAARVDSTLYTLASGVSCWAWSALFTLLGYWAGGFALTVLAFTRRLDVRLGMIALLLLAVLFVITRRRRIAERAARLLTGEDIPIVTTVERRTPANPVRDSERGG